MQCYQRIDLSKAAYKFADTVLAKQLAILINMRAISKFKAFSLIEVLIVTVILAIALINYAALNQKTARLARDAENYAIAVSLAEEIANRLNANLPEARSNPSAYLASRSSLLSDFTTITPTSAFTTNSSNNTDESTNDSGYANNLLTTAANCYSSTTGGLCTTPALAVADLLDWKAMVQSSLPNGTAKICYDSNPTINANSMICDNIILYLSAGGAAQACFANSDAGVTCNPTTPTGLVAATSKVFTIKIQWTDSTNTNRYFISKTTIPY